MNIKSLARAIIDACINCDNVDYEVATLYNTCNANPQLLLDLEAADCQCVGLAFTEMAIHSCLIDKKSNKRDYAGNEVCAENAIYCLGKCLLDAVDNVIAAPTLFHLLEHEKLVWDPLRTVAFNRCGASVLLDLELLKLFHHSSFYVLSHFYDIRTSSLLISMNPFYIPIQNYYLPHPNTITDFLETLKKNREDYTSDEYLKTCRQDFIEIHNVCAEMIKGNYGFL